MDSGGAGGFDMEFPIVILCYYWGVFVVRSVPRGTMRLSTPPPLGETGTLTRGGRNQAVCSLGPLGISDS